MKCNRRLSILAVCSYTVIVHLNKEYISNAFSLIPFLFHNLCVHDAYQSYELIVVK